MRDVCTLGQKYISVGSIPVIKEEAEKCDLKFENYIEKNKWVATKFTKR